MVARPRWRVGGGARWVVNGVVTDQGVVLGPVGCYMYSSERIGALVVGHWRADQVWERGSTRAGNGTAVVQWAHHGHGNNVVVVVLHAHGMRLRARTVCL